jgi:hypothetical protein
MDDMQMLEDEMRRESRKVVRDDIDLPTPMRINWVFPSQTSQFSEGKSRKVRLRSPQDSKPVENGESSRGQKFTRILPAAATLLAIRIRPRRSDLPERGVAKIGMLVAYQDKQAATMIG